ncbi:hypothetical protein ZOSMA_317G00240 [Zostera marina]|uniref:Transcription factor MYC/MYB N-terminal domain-containing protein n=1 Tax=Zostera marina TaxID=29655 RepID=A0A0K9P976_ZOSMR|nr:hypothetical protein ZOSMA_317G00240 [Zostera marina]
MPLYSNTGQKLIVSPPTHHFVSSPPDSNPSESMAEAIPINEYSERVSSPSYPDVLEVSLKVPKRKRVSISQSDCDFITSVKKFSGDNKRRRWKADDADNLPIKKWVKQINRLKSYFHFFDIFSSLFQSIACSHRRFGRIGEQHIDDERFSIATWLHPYASILSLQHHNHQRFVVFLSQIGASFVLQPRQFTATSQIFGGQCFSNWIFVIFCQLSLDQFSGNSFFSWGDGYYRGCDEKEKTKVVSNSDEYLGVQEHRKNVLRKLNALIAGPSPSGE